MNQNPRNKAYSEKVAAFCVLAFFFLLAVRIVGEFFHH